MRLLIIVLTCHVALHSFAQASTPSPAREMGFATLGILQGGGSLIGFDIEVLATKRLGLQVGGGFKGYGGGLNYHIKPEGRSSFISLQYWHQGFDDTYTQSVAGPNFVYRSKKWFTAQLGVGAALEQGPAWPEKVEQPPYMLMYAIGGYFPW